MFASNDTLIIDGGLSTQVERHGVNVNDPLWTARVLLEQPQVISAAHRDFVEAGADILISSSYQVSRAGFIAAGLTAQQADAALTASVRLARNASGPDTVVAASVGPYGAITHDGAEYRGRYGLSRTELAQFHRERMSILAEAQPDLFAIETIPDADELDALADAMPVDSEIPAWVSLTFRDAQHLWSGHTISDAIARAQHIPGVQALGVNCTDPAFVSEIVRTMKEQADLPVVVYPNAGGVWDAQTSTWSQPPADLAAYVQEWSEAGAQGIGGCCGTDAAAVRLIAAAVPRAPR